MKATTRLPIAMTTYDRVENDGEGNIRLSANASPQVWPEPLTDDSLEVILNRTNRCQFCGTWLIDIEDRDLSFERFIEHDSAIYEKRYWLSYCLYCRFWQSYVFEHSDEWGQNSDGCPPGAAQVALVSKARDFEKDLPEPCSEELAVSIRRNPRIWHTYNAYRFEKFVGDIFRANYHSAEVVHVGCSGDGGKDLLFIEANDRQWITQVKRREHANAVEGVETVRSLLGTLFEEQIFRGIVVSTAERFSTPAQRLANKMDSRGVIIRLIDRGLLNRMLDPLLPDRPWLEVLEREDAVVASYFAAHIPSDLQLPLFPNEDVRSWMQRRSKRPL